MALIENDELVVRLRWKCYEADRVLPADIHTKYVPNGLSIVQDFPGCIP